MVVAEDIAGRAHEAAVEVAARARASGKRSVLGLTATANVRNPALYFSGPRESAESTGCSAILRDAGLCLPVAQAVDGMVDWLLLDVEAKIAGWSGAVAAVRQAIRRSGLLTYHPNDLTARGIDALVAGLGIWPDGRPMAVIGAGHLGARIAQRLVERGHPVRLWRRDRAALSALCEGLNAMRAAHTAGQALPAPDPLAACRDARAVIGCTPGTAAITPAMIQGLAADALVVDAGNGTLAPEAIAHAHARGLQVLCGDLRAAYEGEIAALLRAAEMVRSRIGSRPVGPARMISGGLLGQRGDIIVDDYARPTQILGIADGGGDVVTALDAAEWRPGLAAVRAEIARRKERA